MLAVDGAPLRDVIDWRWGAAGNELQVQVDRNGTILDLELERSSGPWGVSFEDVVFDGVRTCRNDCEFCFVDQLPEGLRGQLYLRDDDYRLSFLLGNFITLTNLDEVDLQRIEEQRLSPLYVSLHAIRPEVRKRLIRCPGADHAVEAMGRLMGSGIELHVQIVLVPGVNDGAVLDETLDWLGSRTGVLSVGVVPLGFTGHQDRYETSFDAPGASGLIDVIEARRGRRAESGLPLLVQAADEFYLTAGRPLPAAAEYEGFPQLENGIGLARVFLDEWSELAIGGPDGVGDLVLCTGELFAPLLEAASRRRWADDGPRVLAVTNRFFGGGVSVAGLLTGADLIRTIVGDASDLATEGRYVIPDVVLNDDGLTLDGMTAASIADAAAPDVSFAPHDVSGFNEWLADHGGVRA